MDAGAIARTFQSAIDEAAKGAGANPDADIKGRLSQLTSQAGRLVAEAGEYEQERATDEGVAAYKKLIEKMVAAAKSYRMFPELNKHAWDTALGQLGPNPPYYF